MLVSIIVPTHLRPEMLAEALASIKGQTFSDYEIIVISNGEGARGRLSYDVAMKFGARYYAYPEGSVAIARNFGISVALGEWIAFLDDDDLWLPKKLERQIAEAEASGADMLICDAKQIFPDGREQVNRPRIKPGWSYAKAFSHHWWTPTPGVLVRKAAIDRAGGFDSTLKIGEDLDLWRRIAWRHKVHLVPEVLIAYRSGHESLTRRRWVCCVWDLAHYRKMLRDTPAELRSALPPAASFLPWRVLRILLPDIAVQWLRQPRKTWEALRRREEAPFILAFLGSVGFVALLGIAWIIRTRA